MNLRLPAIGGRTAGTRELTGRSVLLMLVVFFGLVMVVNVVMVDAALSTLGGVDTPSSYQAGLNFKADEAAAAAQNARDWKVSARLSQAKGVEAVTVDIVDEAGRPVAGVDVAAHFVHPVDEHHDAAIAMREVGSGSYAGTADVAAGQWILDIEVTKSGERLFRSRNRVMIE